VQPNLSLIRQPPLCAWLLSRFSIQRAPRVLICDGNGRGWGCPRRLLPQPINFARLIYAMFTKGADYVDAGQEYYEVRYRSRVAQNKKRKAREFAFEWVALKETAAAI